MGKARSEPVPEARRSRFPRWPRKGLSERARRVGLEGVAHAREELVEHTPDDDLHRGRGHGVSPSSD
ncbi:MAG: hypothetical protein OES57_03945 [Acidimicrobiia bacterium]|nr:hypothetical protein [Acidimicrobiia bacterium]